jgi:hypothetical protein
LENLGVDGRIILKWILEKLIVKKWSGLKHKDNFTFTFTVSG